MKQIVFAIGFCCFLVIPCFADDFMGEARCRAAVLQGHPDRDYAQITCADVKSEADGICRAGYMAHAINGKSAREACSDVKTVTEAKCRARLLFRYGNIQGARDGCRSRHSQDDQDTLVKGSELQDFKRADLVKTRPTPSSALDDSMDSDQL